VSSIVNDGDVCFRKTRRLSLLLGAAGGEMSKHARRGTIVSIGRSVDSSKNAILTNFDVCEIPPTKSERFVAELLLPLLEMNG
jgi:hypothetical protein